jgi:hypothetical protein
MRKTEHRSEPRVEVVTTTFVASGRPEGIHDLSRFLETLNNPTIARQIEFRAPSVRPLYRAGAQIQLEAPLLVRRDDIVFANFEGPNFARAGARPALRTAPVLLLAPPFQISGMVDIAATAEASPALRTATTGFFVVRQASVYDADGHPLGEGELIVVNSGAVQMMSATRQHIEEARTTTPAARIAPMAEVDEAEREATRAA